MKQQETSKTLPQLIKGSATYKLIVPENVEEKIRYLLRKFPSTEWSGVLFVTHKGTFENNDLVITCKDIYPMDLGNATFTEFKMNEDVAAYMAENIDLFYCELQLVHSHHQMPTTPSSTDLNTLREEGNDRNCFVSLIVNNAGTYYAAITRKIQTKSEISIKRLGTSYEFFGDGSKTVKQEEAEPITKVIDKEVIEYFDLDIERHEVPNTLSYLDDRFEEITQNKRKVSQESKPFIHPILNTSDNNFTDWFSNEEKSENLPFTNPKETLTEEEKGKLDDAELDWQPDPNKIHKALCHIITCNFILNTEKFNLRQWIRDYMVKVYNRIFCSKNSLFDNPFEEWADFSIQFTLDHFNTEDVPGVLLEDIDMFYSIIAQALMMELEEFKNANKYINSYYSRLEKYLIE